MAAFDIMIVTAYGFNQKWCSFIPMRNLPDPTPPMINDLTALMVGNCRTVEFMLSVVTMHWSVYKLCWVVIRKGIEDIYDAGSR